MPVKIRLQRKGRKQAPFYHIVIADARSPRDGRFIEKIGTYNPLTTPATIELNNEKAYQWLKNGAQPTDTVRSILRFKGVLYQKHLDRGVGKGAMTPEEAAEKLETWITEKQNRIAAGREATVQKKLDFKVKVDGVKKVKAKPVPVVEEAPVNDEETAPMAEETTTTAEVEAPPVEETAAAEVAAPAAEVEAPEVTAEAAAPVAEETVATAEVETPATEEAPEVTAEAEETVATAEVEAPAAEVESPEVTAVAEETVATAEVEAPAAEEAVAAADGPAPATEEAAPDAEAEKTKEA